jgi:hypothetical protein
MVLAERFIPVLALDAFNICVNDKYTVIFKISKINLVLSEIFSTFVL